MKCGNIQKEKILYLQIRITDTFGDTSRGVTLDEDSTWGDILEEVQNCLRSHGFIFDKDFSFREVLEEAHRESLEKKNLRVEASS